MPFLCTKCGDLQIVEKMPEDDPDRGSPIIDELLCFIQSKIDILDMEIIVQLCIENVNFTADVIIKSKEMFFEMCHTEFDKTERKNRIGDHKSERNLKDIYNLFQEKGQNTPIFVARDLNILPPVTYKSVDVSLLLHTINKLQIEMKSLKDAVELQRQTSQDLFDCTNTLDKRVTQIESVEPNKAIPPVIVKNPSDKSAENVILPMNPKAPAFVSKQVVTPLYSNALAKNSTTSDLIVDSDGFVMIGPNGKPLRTVKPVNSFPNRRNSNVVQKKQKPVVVGNSSRSSITAATRYVKASVFASRYPPGTTTDEVKSDLLLDERAKELNINVETVQAKYDTYASFHVTCVCQEDEAQLFLASDFWPSGILYRRWKEKRNRNDDTNGGFNWNRRGGLRPGGPE